MYLSLGMGLLVVELGESHPEVNGRRFIYLKNRGHAYQDGVVLIQSSETK